MSTTKDTRTLSERFAAVRRALGPNCIEKRGMKKINGVEIWYVMADDLAELVRPLLAAEGIDLRIGMDPTIPVVEKGLKTAKGGLRYEYQCWFKITAKCPGEEDVEWWMVQDTDTGICSTYAFKFYLMKRLQLSGGYSDVPHDDGEYLPQEPQPTQSRANLRVTDDGQRGPRKSDGQGPPAPAESTPPKDDFEPEDMDRQATKAEWDKAWKVWVAHHPDAKAAKAAFVGKFPHIVSPKDARKRDILEMESVGADKVPF